MQQDHFLKRERAFGAFHGTSLHVSLSASQRIHFLRKCNCNKKAILIFTIDTVDLCWTPSAFISHILLQQTVSNVLVAIHLFLWINVSSSFHWIELEVFNTISSIIAIAILVKTDDKFLAKSGDGWPHKDRKSVFDDKLNKSKLNKLKIKLKFN